MLISTYCRSARKRLENIPPFILGMVSSLYRTQVVIKKVTGGKNNPEKRKKIEWQPDPNAMGPGRYSGRLEGTAVVPR